MTVCSFFTEYAATTGVQSPDLGMVEGQQGQPTSINQPPDVAMDDLPGESASSAHPPDRTTAEAQDRGEPGLVPLLAGECQAKTVKNDSTWFSRH